MLVPALRSMRTSHGQKSTPHSIAIQSLGYKSKLCDTRRSDPSRRLLLKSRVRDDKRGGEIVSSCFQFWTGAAVNQGRGDWGQYAVVIDQHELRISAGAAKSSLADRRRLDSCMSYCGREGKACGTARTML
jgi:hypothetical protein